MVRRKTVRIAFALQLCLLAGGGFAHAAGARRAIVAVSNPTDLDRPEEILEIPLAEIRTRIAGHATRFGVTNLANHRNLPVQLDSSKADGAADRLLVLVNLAPHQTVRLSIHAAYNPAQSKPWVFGRAVPEHKDDFAWENDKVAYRAYGPALQATDETGSGIDVWSKRVPDLVVNTWYRRDAEGQRTHNPALSYHKDTGQGLDSYEVGPTRGCGGTGVWKDGRLLTSKNYASAVVLAAGPIRFRVRIRYAPWQAGGAEVSEEKIISLDAGSHLNRIESTFSFNGAESGQWAAGLATHAGFHATPLAEESLVSVWEPLTDPDAGGVGTGMVLEPGKTGRITLTGSNALLLLPAVSGAPVVYYAGATWSKSDVPDEAAWIAYLHAFRERLQHPLKTRWE